MVGWAPEYLKSIMPSRKKEGLWVVVQGIPDRTIVLTSLVIVFIPSRGVEVEVSPSGVTIVDSFKVRLAGVEVEVEVMLGVV
jgi:hypothetical protein